MSVSQLSVFAENQPGRLSRLTALLEREAISIRGFAVADTGDFGIVRLIVDEPKKAQSCLQAAGFLVQANDLLCLELPDAPGFLNLVVSAMADAEISVEYGYSLVSTYVVFKVLDVAFAEQQLLKQDIRIINQSDLV
ncbi:MAG: ACT domain-containing protein [Actinomycetia bacterium]|nr:ACT domain-containing protein [Actinomycetes bacterium]